MSALAFQLPSSLHATEPPPARDGIKLMTAHRGTGELEHAAFRDLPELLLPGDLLVVNVSATLPAAVSARRGAEAAELRFATAAPDLSEANWWIVELRSADGTAPATGSAGETVQVPGGEVELVAPYAGGARLWLARLRLGAPVHEYLRAHGHPIRYRYVPREWPLAEYQTAFATQPGSAEMPSAGRPFTPELITKLVARGIHVAPITLHTGVSSLERGESPYPERFQVTDATARLVNAVRWWGGRVIAVGTTVVRALETVADETGAVEAGEGWTRLVVTPERGMRAVDGLITGWHEPEASHLRLLEAAAGRELLERSYDAALERGYKWHEFGDSHLILP